MNSQIAQAIEEILKPRGVHHKDVTTVTTHFTGAFKDDAELRNRFLKLAGYG
jgi:GTP cyclohydrolase I